MKLSIVSTMYRSEAFIERFCTRVLETVREITSDFEIILVNDGSPDKSLEAALKLQKSEPSIQVVELSRNFGHHAAIIAGLEQASGDFVFLIDCDLEEQPEWLPDFFNSMRTEDADVVFGVQRKRVASRSSNLMGEVFWRSLNAFSNVRIPHNPMTCRLMNRAYVDALLRVEDHVLYLAGTFAWTGFRQISIPLVKEPRPGAQKSSYSLYRKLMQVVDSFSSFSIAPLTATFVLGFIIWAGSILIGLWLLIERILHPGTILSGFTSLMLSIWFLSGIVIMTLGVLGLYIGKIFQEVKRRPLYLIRKVHKVQSHE